ncbi:MAG: cytochrome c oxidase subunit II [Chloroflexota bacterium]
MNKGRIDRIGSAVLWLLLTSGVAGCTTTAVTPNSLDPQGYAASRIANLWWLLLGLGSMVYLLVMALLAWALWRKRPLSSANDDANTVERRSRPFIIAGGIVFPAIVLVIVFGSTLNVLAGLNGMQENGRLLIEVVGHQWWWEVNYPHQQFSTANEIHIPVGEPVQFKLNSADVIHSFWAPELHGKLDLVPGQTNTLWLQADKPGRYWGLCAEFCGIQHAKMLFVVVAEPREDFDAWLAAQQELAAVPTDALTQQGQNLFMQVGCSDCHRIRGAQAVGDLGPDLTHFADRLTLGAGIAPNDRESLAAWVLNPHTMKGGNIMPATQLTEDELAAIVAYLQSLK